MRHGSSARRASALAAVIAIFVSACGEARSPSGTSSGTSASSSAAASSSAIASASGSSSSRPSTPDPATPLDVSPGSFDPAANPDLTRRIAESPHAFFRFVNRAFMQAVCARTDSSKLAWPPVRLHGDPHVEQYTVTELGRGLYDYDDAAVGPAAIDLVRFATSVRLANALIGGGKDDAERLVKALLDAYRAGIAGATIPAEAPAFARGLAAKFKSDRKAFLEGADKAMLELAASDTELVRAELALYTKSVKGADVKRSAKYFDLKRFGGLKLGIGSALTRKFLLRVEGASASPDDDVLLELKQASDLSAVSCVKALPDGAAEARAAVQRRAKNTTLAVPAAIDDGRFWVSEWLMNYEEARVKNLKLDDLAELVHEAGLLLAAEHQKAASASAAPPTAKSLTLSADQEAFLVRTSRELAEDSETAWAHFKRDFASAATQGKSG